MRSLLLIHGASAGPCIFDGWSDSFPELEVDVVELQAGLNVPEAAMSNYAAVVYRGADWLPRPLALCGWSMGGLVAMMAAGRCGAEALVLLEPSPPGEVQGFDPEVELAPGIYESGPHDRFPRSVKSRPDSSLARAERKRGISVPSLPCPALVVYGDEFPDQRGRRIASYYGAEELYLDGCEHWGLLLDARARRAAAAYLSSR